MFKRVWQNIFPHFSQNLFSFPFSELWLYTLQGHPTAVSSWIRWKHFSGLSSVLTWSNVKINLQKIVGNLSDKQIIVHEWNGHLEIFSGPQVIENSRQYLLLRTDILQKTVVGCPWLLAVFMEALQCFDLLVLFITWIRPSWVQSKGAHISWSSPTPLLLCFQSTDSSFLVVLLSYLPYVS